MRGFWKHKRSMDAYVLVLKVQYQSSSYLKLRIEWFVRGKSLNRKQTIKIYQSDLRDWFPVNN